MAEPRTSPVFAIILVIIVLVAGGAGAVFLYYENHKSPGSSGVTVQVGDNVTVNYVGVMGSGPQVGHVFDTSQYAVALNNASWPKTLQYTTRGGTPSDYSPLGVYVGPSTPSGGYLVGGTTFISVVPGFWQGLLGLPGNQTRYITVPPGQGYPASLINASCFVTRPLTYSYPVVVVLTPLEFGSQFPDVSATPGTVYSDPVYGWPDLVLSVNSSSVTFENLPTVGTTTNPSGWPVVVSNISATTITLQNQLNPSQAGLVLGHSAGSTVCSTKTFIISQVNLAAGTYVEDYGGVSSSGQQVGNQQVYGQTLIFIVSVVDILPA